MFFVSIEGNRENLCATVDRIGCSPKRFDGDVRCGEGIGVGDDPAKQRGADPFGELDTKLRQKVREHTAGGRAVAFDPVELCETRIGNMMIYTDIGLYIGMIMEKSARPAVIADIRQNIAVGAIRLRLKRIPAFFSELI